MASRQVTPGEPGKTPRRSATTPEGREHELVNLAYNLAEKQFRDGTASSQVTTHFLKMGSSREYLEQRRIAQEVELMEAKKQLMASQENMGVLIEKALEAFREYSGHGPTEEQGDAGDY